MKKCSSDCLEVILAKYNTYNDCLAIVKRCSDVLAKRIEEKKLFKVVIENIETERDKK